MSTFQGEASLFLEALGGVDTNWDTLSLVLATCHCLNVIEITDCPRKKLQKDVKN